MLLHQFHDILPGSLDRVGAPRGAGDVRRGGGASRGASSRPRSTRWPATGPTRWCSTRGRSRGRVCLPWRRVSRLRPDAPRLDRAATGACSRTSTSASSWTRAGVIRRVLDKANDREVLPPGGAANLLQLHPDHPVKWDAWDLDRSYRAKVTDLTARRRDGRRRRRGGDPLLRRILSHATDPARRRPGRDRDRGRLARAGEGAQGGLRRGRAHRPRGVRDPVRSRRPTHPREHHLGRGPVRGVRAPVGARGRRRVRRRAGQRRDVRPRRHPPSARRGRHVLARAAQPAARPAVPRPGDRPGSARAAVRAGARRRRSRGPPRPGTR